MKSVIAVETRRSSARHHGRSVAIFGSVARGNERPGSDIDFLVELEEALGLKVDVGTPESLRERLRDEVVAEAVTL